MSLSAVGVIAVAAFLVSWALTDLLRLPRTGYLAALTVITGAMTYGYLAWSRTDAVAFLTRNWAWGVLGAVISGAVTARGITSAADRAGLAAPAGRSRVRLAGALVWEGVLYGVAEGLLLSALPHQAPRLDLEVNEMTTTQVQERGATAPDQTTPSDPAYDKARERARALQALYVHLFVFALVNGALFLINWATRGPQGDWWFYWPLLGWGVAVVIHLATTFLPVFSPEWVERRAARTTGRSTGR